MNTLKNPKLALIALLIAAQTLSAVPAYAESASPADPTPAPAATLNPEATQAPAPETSAEPYAEDQTGETDENGEPAVPAVTPQPANEPEASVPPAGEDVLTMQQIAAPGGSLILLMNSNKMYMNGREYVAPQPMAVKNGVSYVAIRAMLERIGLDLKYDGATKETIITQGSNVLRFKTNSDIYTVNGERKKMKGAAYQTNNTFMVPLTSLTSALGINYTVDNVKKQVVLNLATKPTASFTVQPGKIYAGQTTVTYTAQSSSPTGAQIVNEVWEGRQEIFEQPGVYTVRYSVQDITGAWSDPYTRTITVEQPNLPPVAAFTTDKEVYRIGEMVTYTDMSTDDRDTTLKTEWANNKMAFFTPGPVTISLTVTDSEGLSDTILKTITITDEVLYTESDFNKLFIPAGDKYDFNGSEVPGWKKVTYDVASDNVMLIRSNSPETVQQEGLVYRESGFGDIRLMVHHVNAMSKNMKMYVIATNNNLWPVTLSTKYSGFGGPINIPTATGKMSIQRYFETMISGSAARMDTLQPGESRAVLTELSDVTMKPGQVISLMSDVYSDYTLQYDVIMVAADKDPIAALPFLPALDRDGVHNRGTYYFADRLITVNETVGTEPARLLLGDRVDDPNLVGVDPMSGTEASNSGNFGVVYRIKLNNVAPNTLITFNPRGGQYMGPMLVNGQIVHAPSVGAIEAPNGASVVYRTGGFTQPVEILFSAASGSNLPVNFLFQPLPPLKQ